MELVPKEAMNLISSVNLNQCCKEMFRADDRLLNGSKPNTTKECPTCGSVNKLVGGVWIRPVESNDHIKSFPVDEEAAKQGLVSASDPRVAEFEAMLPELAEAVEQVPLDSPADEVAANDEAANDEAATDEVAADDAPAKPAKGPK